MASVPTDQERLREAPPSELLRSLLADIRLMLELEAELAKLEVKDKGSRLGIAGGILSGAAVVALLALGTLIAAAVAGLAIVLPLWAAALIVGTVLVVVAVVMKPHGRTWDGFVAKPNASDRPSSRDSRRHLIGADEDGRDTGSLAIQGRSPRPLGRFGGQRCLDLHRARRRSRDVGQGR